MKRAVIILLLALSGLAIRPERAFADITVFWGAVPTVTTRPASGLAIGLGLVVFGVEFEHATADANEVKAAPGLSTDMFNGLLMTPNPGAQLYITGGGGLFRESLGASRKTGFGTNAGGGVKLRVAGRLRLRLDYRVFTLTSGALVKVVQRFYAGGNISF